MIQLELPLFADEREQVRQMELLTYSCGARREYHQPHRRADSTGWCAGLQSRCCENHSTHPHHRWWVIPDAFYWCNGVHRSRSIEDVELP